jgi:uncharacterized repeat protein (TIGR03987 family)
MAGVGIVNAALICYSIGVISEQRSHIVSKKVISFLTVGVVLDVIATICMIIGSTNSPFSTHGILGYSSLTAMVIETALAWRHRLAHGDARVSAGLHRYSLIAYLWWVAAYITGGVLVAMG